jgi:hypothetical protein
MKNIKIVTILITLLMLSTSALALMSIKDFDVWKSPFVEHRASVIMKNLIYLDNALNKKLSDDSRENFTPCMVVMENVKTKTFIMNAGLIFSYGNDKKDVTLMLLDDNLNIMSKKGLKIVEFMTLYDLEKYYNYKKI